jgi:hypothetical protein
MKKFVFITLLSIQFHAQTKHETLNFYIEEKEVYWQKTYDSTGSTVEDLVKNFETYVIKSMKTENLRYSENSISFFVAEAKINLKDFNKKAMTTPIFVQSWQSYLCVVEFKDNKYRVTLKEIYFTNKQSGMGGFNDSFSSLIIAKDGNFKTGNNAKTSLELLESYYDKIYKPENVFKKGADW